MTGHAPKQLIVATCTDGDEAIYVDGKLVFEDKTVCACDIGNASGDGVITFRHVNVDLPDSQVRFPATLDELKPFVCPSEPPLDNPGIACLKQDEAEA